MSRYFEKLPENLNQMSGAEIEAIAENIWLKINAECNPIDRDTKLRLRQKAYSIWIEKYPHETDDDVDCHLEEIYSWLLSEYLRERK